MSRLPSDETEQIPIPGYSAAGLTAAAQQSMKVDFGASSHVGKVRAKNQDHFSIVRIARSLDVVSSNIPRFEIPEKVEEFAYGMVVAAGMGGMAGGERASILAIQTGIRLVLEAPKWALRIDEQEARQLVDRMRVYFQQVDATLIRETLYDPSLTGMGTTLTVAYSVGSHAFVVHAGGFARLLVARRQFSPVNPRPHAGAEPCRRRQDPCRVGRRAFGPTRPRQFRGRPAAGNRARDRDPRADGRGSPVALHRWPDRDGHRS